MEKVATVKAGEVYRWKEHMMERERETVVLHACANKNNGRWACVTHGKSFDNQLQKDSHIHTGKHRLIWLCFEHGAEQP
jgi:hypothetical protein